MYRRSGRQKGLPTCWLTPLTVNSKAWSLTSGSRNLAFKAWDRFTQNTQNVHKGTIGSRARWRFACVWAYTGKELQRDELCIWNSCRRRTYASFIFIHKCRCFLLLTPEHAIAFQCGARVRNSPFATPYPVLTPGWADRASPDWGNWQPPSYRCFQQLRLWPGAYCTQIPNITY